MEKTLFDDLLQSLKEAKAISKGKAKASRRIKVEATDVKAVRAPAKGAVVDIFPTP